MWLLTVWLAGHGGTGQGLDSRVLESFFSLSGSGVSVTAGARQQSSRFHCQQKSVSSPMSLSVPQPQGCSVSTHVALGDTQGQENISFFSCSHQNLTPVITNPGAAPEAPSAHGTINLPDFSSFLTKADRTQPNQEELLGFTPVKQH